MRSEVIFRRHLDSSPLWNATVGRSTVAPSPPSSLISFFFLIANAPSSWGSVTCCVSLGVSRPLGVAPRKWPVKSNWAGLLGCISAARCQNVRIPHVAVKMAIGSTPRMAHPSGMVPVTASLRYFTCRTVYVNYTTWWFVVYSRSRATTGTISLTTGYP